MHAFFIQELTLALLVVLLVNLVESAFQISGGVTTNRIVMMVVMKSNAATLVAPPMNLDVAMGAASIKDSFAMVTLTVKIHLMRNVALELALWGR